MRDAYKVSSLQDVVCATRYTRYASYRLSHKQTTRKLGVHLLIVVVVVVVDFLSSMCVLSPILCPHCPHMKDNESTVVLFFLAFFFFFIFL